MNRTFAPPGVLPSPCVSICRMDPVRGLCEGCLRTIDEIAGWSSMTEARKREVWDALALRREADLDARRRG